MATTSTASPGLGAQRPGAETRQSWAGAPARGLAPLAIGLVIWQLVGDKSSPYFPPPSEWVAAVRPLVEKGELVPAIGWTAFSFALGLVLATVVGTVVGILIGSSRVADRALGPTLEFLRSLPAASIVPMAALLMGYTLSMKLTIVVLTASWPILLAVRTGRRSMSKVLLDVPKTLGLSRSARLCKIVIPAQVRSILLGVRVSAPVVLIITLLVEILTRMDGVGALLSTAQANFRSAEVYGLLVIAGVLGYLVNIAVSLLDGFMARRLGVQI